MNTKQFVIASLLFMVMSLGAIFGLTVLFARVLMPDSPFDTLVCRYLGDRGPLIVILVAYVLGVGLVYLLLRKLVIARFRKSR